MEIVIPNFSSYTVDENGIVKETKSNGIVVPEIGRRGNEYRVTIKNDSWKVVRPKVSRLVMTSFRPIPNVDYAWFTVVYLNRDMSCYQLDNLMWNIGGYYPPNDPLDPDNKHMLFPVPGFSNYGVTPSGFVYNLITGDILHPGLSNVGYFCCRVTNDIGKSTYVGVHHLMVLALLDHPWDVDQLVINHLNGVKTDNRPSNLEWATYSRNIHHAYYNELRTEIIPVYARHAKTNELMTLPSIGEAARFFGNCNPGKIHWWLYNGSKEKVRDGWYVSLTNDWN